MFYLLNRLRRSLYNWLGNIRMFKRLRGRERHLRPSLVLFAISSLIHEEAAVLLVDMDDLSV